MKILLAVDGSPHSNSAVEFTCRLPVVKPEYVLVHVKPPLPFPVLGIPEEAGIDYDGIATDIQQKAQEYIESARITLQDRGEIISTTIIAGQAAEEILNVAEAHHVELIVLGARGHHPFDNFFLGSVADKVLRHTHCSVLLFRNDKDYELPLGKLGIVVGFDDSPAAQEASEWLASWNSRGLRKVFLLQCAQPYLYQGAGYAIDLVGFYPSLINSLEKRLQERATELQKRMPDVAIEAKAVYGMDTTANDLNEYAKTHHCALIMVGSKGKSLVDRVILGSVSTQLAHHADMPVLVVRERTVQE